MGSRGDSAPTLGWERGDRVTDTHSEVWGELLAGLWDFVLAVVCPELVAEWAEERAAEALDGGCRKTGSRDQRRLTLCG